VGLLDCLEEFRDDSRGPHDENQRQLVLRGFQRGSYVGMRDVLWGVSWGLARMMGPSILLHDQFLVPQIVEFIRFRCL
jgi:hypothetical protein